MHPTSSELLQRICAQLDLGRYPIVHDGGLVMSSPITDREFSKGPEQSNEATRRPTRKTKPERPSSKWSPASTSWARAPYRPWTPRAATSVIDPVLRGKYEDQVNAFLQAYPATKIWRYNNEMWLLAESLVLTGLDRKATFLLRLSYSPTQTVECWAYWTTAVSRAWIGPRHTNFPNGSVCAFDPKDKTWSPGESLVLLLDLYTVWALRHLALEKMGRWPGYQSVPHGAERLIEFQDHELCGCDQSGRLYSECCKPSDLAGKNSKEMLDFWMKSGGLSQRKPPPFVADVIMLANAPPHT